MNADKTRSADGRVRRSRPDLDAHEPQTARFSTGERLVSSDELAALLGLTVGTVRWMKHDGQLPPAAKVGRRLVWKESEILAWLDELFAADEDHDQKAA